MLFIISLVHFGALQGLANILLPTRKDVCMLHGNIYLSSSGVIGAVFAIYFYETEHLLKLFLQKAITDLKALV